MGNVFNETAEELISTWGSYKEDVCRPNWDEYYLCLAEQIAQRSIDRQTQHGCIITDQEHIPLGLGYNSFVRGIDDTILPNVRPEKYPFMIHAELNAILNCSLRPQNGIAYITGPPCVSCLQYLWQAGIKEIVFGNKQHKSSDKDKIIHEILVKLLMDAGISYRQYRESK